MPGGARPGCKKPQGSGRKKGTLNKRSVEVRDQLEELGCNPIAFLAATVLNDRKFLGLADGKDAPDVPLKYREDAARDLLQYIAPKLKSIDFKSSDGSAIETFAAAVATLSAAASKKK